MVRRSMPWGDVRQRRLYFVAYGESLDRFERVLSRMAGLEDGVVDGLATFTRAVSGATTGVHPCATASSICAPSGSDPFVAAPEPGRKPPLLGPCSDSTSRGTCLRYLGALRAAGGH